MVKWLLSMILNVSFNLGTQIRQFNLSDEVVVFNTSTFPEWTPPFTGARIPLEGMKSFSTNDNVRIIANIYRNISIILPTGINRYENDE